MTADTVSATASRLRRRLSAGPAAGTFPCSASASLCSGSGPTCTARLSGPTGAAGATGLPDTTCATGSARTARLSGTASATIATRCSTVLISGLLVPVWRVPAMLRIVLPVFVRVVNIVLLVVVVYVLVVDVDVHVTVVPAAVVAPASPPRCAEGESCPE